MANQRNRDSYSPGNSSFDAVSIKALEASITSLISGAASSHSVRGVISSSILKRSLNFCIPSLPINMELNFWRRNTVFFTSESTDPPIRLAYHNTRVAITVHGCNIANSSNILPCNDDFAFVGVASALIVSSAQSIMYSRARSRDFTALSFWLSRIAQKAAIASSIVVIAETPDQLSSLTRNVTAQIYKPPATTQAPYLKNLFILLLYQNYKDQEAKPATREMKQKKRIKLQRIATPVAINGRWANLPNGCHIVSASGLSADTQQFGDIGAGQDADRLSVLQLLAKLTKAAYQAGKKLTPTQTFREPLQVKGIISKQAIKGHPFEDLAKMANNDVSHLALWGVLLNI